MSELLPHDDENTVFPGESEDYNRGFTAGVEHYRQQIEPFIAHIKGNLKAIQAIQESLKLKLLEAIINRYYRGWN
jgi:hypothetical protein